MPKQIKEIKEFLNTARRKDASAVKIKRNVNNTKFKVRCSRYLYTLVVDGKLHPSYRKFLNDTHRPREGWQTQALPSPRTSGQGHRTKKVNSPIPDWLSEELNSAQHPRSTEIKHSRLSKTVFASFLHFNRRSWYFLHLRLVRNLHSSRIYPRQMFEYGLSSLPEMSKIVIYQNKNSFVKTIISCGSEWQRTSRWVHRKTVGWIHEGMLAVDTDSIASCAPATTTAECAACRCRAWTQASTRPRKCHLTDLRMDGRWSSRTRRASLQWQTFASPPLIWWLQS